VGIARFAGPWLARQNDGESAKFVAGRVGEGTVCEPLQSGLDSFEIVKGIKTIGAAAEFAGSLGTAKHKKTKDGGFIAAKVENRTDAVLVLGYARIVDGGDEREVLKRMESLPNLLFGQVQYGIAAGALVARVDQSVERERIIFRRGDLFFDQGAENAELQGIEAHIYISIRIYQAAMENGLPGRRIMRNTYGGGRAVISHVISRRRSSALPCWLN
jgi:hypothetical protein